MNAKYVHFDGIHNDAWEIGVDIFKEGTTQKSQFLQINSLGIFKGLKTICFEINFSYLYALLKM